MDPNKAPKWTLLAPLVALTALAAGNPPDRLYVALPAAIVFAAMQWFVPECRFRTENYLSPVNLAQFLMFLKLVVAPALIAIVGPGGSILSALPSSESMEAALAIDVVAYVSMCLGLAFLPEAPFERGRRGQAWPRPDAGMIAVFAVLGVAGFIAEFGSIGRLVEYFTAPSAVTQIQQTSEGTIVGLLGTFLRPFFAISLIAWWTGLADRRAVPVWLITVAGIVTALSVAFANMTFNFNRAAFVFPLIALAGIYHMRIQRIPLAVSGGLVAVALPMLLMLSSYRTSLMAGAEASPENAVRYAGESIAENVQGYAVGPQYTGLFYDRVGWGDDLYWGTTLLSSVMSPVPVLGKGFREGSGPALFNRAIYGIGGIEDQILPFDAELFANFHLPGTIAGLMAVGFLLGRAERWIASAESSFLAFSLQYAAIWGAMLAAWSLAIYSQILIYFFGPVYFYFLLTHIRGWLGSPPAIPGRWGIAR